MHAFKTCGVRCARAAALCSTALDRRVLGRRRLGPCQVDGRTVTIVRFKDRRAVASKVKLGLFSFLTSPYARVAFGPTRVRLSCLVLCVRGRNSYFVWAYLRHAWGTLTRGIFGDAQRIARTVLSISAPSLFSRTWSTAISLVGAPANQYCKLIRDGSAIADFSAAFFETIATSAVALSRKSCRHRPHRQPS